MTTFAVVILVLMLIALSIGWAYLCVTWLKEGEIGENFVACGIVTLVFIIAVWFIVKYIIVWGHALL